MITKFLFIMIVAVMALVGGPPGISAPPGATMTVHAIMVDGKARPHIELPVVEITGDLESLSMVRAERYGSEIIPSFDLPEVTVYPSI